MKPKNLLNLLALGAVLALTAVGCRTGIQNGKGMYGQRPPKPTDEPLPQPPINPQRPVIGDGIPPTPPSDWPADPNMPLKAQTIYFDFDKSSVKSAEQSKLEAVADYLKKNAAVAVRVEGNCDERGTEEYNRSLGERRALAAREYLVHLGIPPERINTISYGADKPAEQGHGEATWSKNRRDDFVVLLPPGRP